MSDRYTPILLSLPGSLAPSLAVEILPHGVTIHKVIVQVDGKTHDIVIGPEDPKDHSTVKYTNSIIGRYANRVPVGTHTVEKDGISSSFTVLANENPEVSLHGGPEGFDCAVWTRLGRLEDATLFSKAEVQSIMARTDGTAAIFSLTSHDGDQGYSGTLYLETLVVLLPPVARPLTAQRALGSIVIVYRAKLIHVPEGQAMVTPINLTQHWGFNLDASLQGSNETRSVLDHHLTIQASHVAELLPNALPSGRYIPVAEADHGSGAHVHAHKRLGHQLPGIGYDDYYVLARPDVPSTSPHRIPNVAFSDTLDLVHDIFTAPRNEPVLTLSSDASRLGLELDTNQTGMMLYTHNHADPAGCRKKIHGGTGRSEDGYSLHAAVFVECHEPLAAFLYPTGTSTDTLLTSNEIYNHYVRVDVLTWSSEAKE